MPESDDSLSSAVVGKKLVFGPMAEETVFPPSDGKNKLTFEYYKYIDIMFVEKAPQNHHGIRTLYEVVHGEILFSVKIIPDRY